MMSRIFDEPSHPFICPVGDRGSVGPVMLIPIVGTEEGNNIEAQQVHVGCVVTVCSQAMVLIGISKKRGR